MPEERPGSTPNPPPASRAGDAAPGPDGPPPGVPPTDRDLRRLDRQIAAIARAAPLIGRLLRPVRERWGAMVRLPVALLLILGGLLSFLPVLGIWMLPLGLLLLAIDLPLLRPAVSGAIVRLRRRWTMFRRR